MVRDSTTEAQPGNGVLED